MQPAMSRPPVLSTPALGALLLAAPAFALAAFAPPAHAEDAASAPADDPHHHPAAEIVVTGALPGNRLDALSGVAVLQATRLDQAIRPSIGETLAKTPGVSATSFGPTASRPVLRGLQGERVQVLSDGIGAIDVSNTSVDHASVVNPLLAQRIEVLRGPQSLLYGASAIGGVVNVIEKRIPTDIPKEAYHLGALATYGSAARERSLGGTLEVPLPGRFVFHADASYDKADDMRIGGAALSPALRATALATAAAGTGDPGIDYAGNAAVSGTLPSTAARTWTAGTGLSYVGGQGMLGLSYTHTDSLYGVPIRFATAPGEGEEAPRIKLRQDRIDARAEIDPAGGALQSILFRFGYANYAHSELDPAGAIGTTFFNQGIEARLELKQARSGPWQGASGVQFVNRDFDVVGNEAFLPKSTTRQLGLFTVQQVELGAWKLEAGARFERSALTAQPGPSQPQFFAGERRFDTLSGSFGAALAVAPSWRVGLNLSRTERAPAAEELFANGPHAGTEAFEIGNPALVPERATSAEAILRGGDADLGFEASAYHTWFANFVYEDRIGAVADGLPIYQVRQGTARWYGFEAQANATLARFGGWTLKADALADWVHATIAGYGPAPRIPPLRVQGTLALASEKWDLSAEVERTTAQDRVAPNETPTPGFTTLGASVAWRPWGEDHPLSFLLSGNNLFDVVARRHASYLKDYAPLAGRDIRLTARLEL